MKRSLSILLVLSILLTSCLFIASCGKVKTKDFEKDAYTALQEVSNKTYEEFLTDDAGMASIIRDALKSGSVTFGFEGDEELVGAELKIAETIYFDNANKKYVSDTSVVFDGKSLAARLFVDKNGIAINGKDILGSDKTLAVNFKTLAEQFAESSIKDLICPPGTDAEAISEITNALNILKTEYEKLFSDDAGEKYKELGNEIYKLMEMTIAEEKLTLENGKTAKCVAVEYTVNNDVYKSVIDMIFEDIEYPEEYKEEIDASVDEMMEELNEYDIDIISKLYINKKTGKAVKGLVEFSAKEKGGEDLFTLKTATTYSDNEIKITFNADTPEGKFEGDFTITKEVKDGKVVYKMVINAGDGKGATVNFLNVSYTYDKSSGAVTLAADVYGEGEERLAITVKGAINVTNTSAKIEIKSVSFAGETYDFKLSLAFNKSAEMPTIPSDAEDVVTLTQYDIMEIMEEISTSKLFELMDGIAGEP